MATNDELEAIERSALGGAAAERPTRPGPEFQSEPEDKRGGSSLFADSGGEVDGGLLVDFPGSDDDSSDDDDRRGSGSGPPATNSATNSGQASKLNGAPPPRMNQANDLRSYIPAPIPAFRGGAAATKKPSPNLSKYAPSPIPAFGGGVPDPIPPFRGQGGSQKNVHSFQGGKNYGGPPMRSNEPINTTRISPSGRQQPRINPIEVAASPAPLGAPPPRQRNSVVLQPVAMGGLLGLDDSDYDDSDDDGPGGGGLPGAPMPDYPGQPNTNRISNSSAPGGPNSRPMVGGFAAAAYEAAKAHHYQNEARRRNSRKSLGSQRSYGGQRSNGAAPFS